MISIFQSIFLTKIIKKGIISICIKNGFVLNLYVKKEFILKILFFLKKSTLFRYQQLLDITAVDYLGRNFLERFELTYLLLSINQNSRIFVKLDCNENSSVFSTFSLYKSSSWLEREVWDMFGIYFIEHPDLRRILTDYGFFGYPLRKDFPLSGFFEVRYDDLEKRVVSEPIEMTQEFRLFQFLRPWGNKT